MEQEFSLEQFFSMEYEMLYNKCFACPLTEEQETNVMEYIKWALSTPLSEFFQYIKDNPKASYDVGNITQASRISLCHYEMCEALLRANDRGLNTTEIGWYLHNDNVVRTKNTEAKYGENVKGAQQLGLAIMYKQRWYLTCLGKVFLKLDDNDRMALLARTLLRDPFYKHIFCAASYASVDILDYMIGIAASTEQRRVTSVKQFCAILQKQAYIEGVSLFEIKYPSYVRNQTR